MSATARTHPVSERNVERLIIDRLGVVERALGFRPDVHLDWPAGTGISRAVADAMNDALEVSLGRVAHHRGSTSAFVSVALRRDAVEVCVIDNGAPYHRAQPAYGRLSASTGVEHDVDDFDDAGICQWWSIPLDVGL